ncbi:hypothetical protein Krad_0795 [Kineococcus radiotolerans SRS30216 = ATCC BAA-149]|uniref:Uncharacterized protein n=1 Tax=Kineococcus radiotolerans (strain ATCC BAA-149 / DSM 14245 / SRS30216) TaxID=266940 RepID=A6W644_KINRD|nr:hypothetical protein Krad_0795 [Kineococcus radiotolerans SRS30216 = ATCC BAA-149]
MPAAVVEFPIGSNSPRPGIGAAPDPGCGPVLREGANPDHRTRVQSNARSKVWDAPPVSGGQLRRNGQRPLGAVFREALGGERPAVRHCWVRAADGSAADWPGVVVAWVRGPDGWRGRVVYVVPGPEPVVVEAWVEAGNLRAAGPTG